MQRITITIEDLSDTGHVTNTESNWWEVEDGGTDLWTVLCSMVPVMADSLACINIRAPGTEKFDG